MEASEMKRNKKNRYAFLNDITEYKLVTIFK